MLCSVADAASAAATAAAVAVKPEPASPAAEVKDSGEGEREAREQLAKRDAELAKERAACLKLQRYCACSPSVT